MGEKPSKVFAIPVDPDDIKDATHDAKKAANTAARQRRPCAKRNMYAPTAGAVPVRAIREARCSRPGLGKTVVGFQSGVCVE